MTECVNTGECQGLSVCTGGTGVVEESSMKQEDEEEEK